MSTLSIVSIIDDDASVRVAVSNFLLSRGYDVCTFASAEDFLASPQLTATSCVISDVQMSPMNGPELLATMRLRGYAAPFIFITASPDEGVRARAPTAGAAYFLAKPFTSPNLITCLDAALAASVTDCPK